MEQLNARRWPVKRVDISINMEATGENIRRLVKASGYTVDEIREILGLGSKQAVYKWFRGESIPGPENQIILCELFEIEITELLVIDGEFYFFERRSVNNRLNDCLQVLIYNYAVRNGEYSMADYKYEEHRCPYCEHQFVVEMSGTKYILRGSTEEHIRTSCPNCGYKLFVASRWKYGCLAEFVPKEDIKIVSLRI